MQTLTAALLHFAADRLRGDDGATAVEYGLMAALIALVIVGAVQAVGVNVQQVFSNVPLNTALGGN